MLLRKAHQYVKAQNDRVEIDQPQSIFLYNKGMGGVDRHDQNISSYMVGHCSKKWWWPVFRFCFGLSVNNAYQRCRQQKCSERERKLGLLGFRWSLVDTYYRCFRKSTSTNIFPLQESCQKSVMKFDITQPIIGWARESNGDALHVRNPLCTFVENAMLDSVQIFTGSFTSRSNLMDVLVLWFYTTKL